MTAMFAVLELSGKQYLVRENDVIRVDKLTAKEGETVKSDNILLAAGKETKIGIPHVSGASVEFKVLSTGLDKKVRTFKMKAKKRYKRLKGFRASFSDIKITKIHA